MPADLTYYIVEGVLTGIVNGQVVHMIALSGGGGGSTLHKTVMSMNNPYMETLKTVGSGKHHVHGGPLPPGKYHTCTPAHHPHLGLSARLDPATPKPPMGRDGFYIHGTGPHGSDGCIVPTDKTQFQKLMGMLTASNGGTLFVAETMDLSRFA
jgi:hypothetical protein